MSPHSKSIHARNRSASVLSLLAFAFLLSGCAAFASRTPPAAPALALSTTSFNFSSVVIGQSAKQTLHISNTGTAPLTIESVSLQSQEFSFTGPSAPRTVLPAQGADYTISFVPTTSGSLSASLRITTDASSTPAAVSLAGVGENAFAALQVTPASVSFGNLVLQTTGTQTVTVKNTGDINLTISGVTVAGAGFGYSNLSPGISLAPNQSVSFQIWFRPGVLGAASGTISILSASIPSPASISVSGDGVSSTSPPTAQHSVSLSWDSSSSSSIVGYRVYRSAATNTNFVPLTAIIADLSYVDSTVAASNTYYYAVTAVDTAGIESAYSNEVTAVIP